MKSFFNIVCGLLLSAAVVACSDDAAARLPLSSPDGKFELAKSTDQLQQLITRRANAKEAVSLDSVKYFQVSQGVWSALVKYHDAQNEQGSIIISHQLSDQKTDSVVISSDSVAVAPKP
ncbi:hypothetical protein SAMN05421780_101646 [Flexibacter flexilis DSM 6793]|uniref:Lipoprotein n=1 Tax=Flexibacter flexilis DSM 6793 TaxID=927664 RepID=A0A1I1E767_9BACT|nr:hypothetical protein [Flexibacter flexilis]SFB82482.1 hypothetical protein SAMN05421780_101646 [Flexibacter flexilis DSM 6793]